jgi:hypothetical protein
MSLRPSDHSEVYVEEALPPLQHSIEELVDLGYGIPVYKLVDIAQFFDVSHTHDGPIKNHSTPVNNIVGIVVPMDSSVEEWAFVTIDGVVLPFSIKPETKDQGARKLKDPNGSIQVASDSNQYIDYEDAFLNEMNSHVTPGIAKKDASRGEELLIHARSVLSPRQKPFPHGEKQALSIFTIFR